MSVTPIELYEDDIFEDGVFADFSSSFISRIDITDKVIFIKDTVKEFHPVDDLYTEVRAIRRLDESVRKMYNPLSAQGNEPAGANFTPRRAILNDGWRIAIEYRSNCALSITGELISDDGLAGAQLVKLDYLPSGISTLVNYTPPSSEVIKVSTTGASGASAQELWEYNSRTLTAGAGLKADERAKLYEIDGKIDDLSVVLSSIDTIIDSLPVLSEIRDEMINVQFGALEITNNQMIIKDKVGTIIAVLDLFDKNGNPSMTTVFKREVSS